MRRLIGDQSDINAALLGLDKRFDDAPACRQSISADQDLPLKVGRCPRR